MSETKPSGWAVGLTAFAGFMMILVGFFQALAGFAALLEDEFYVIGQEYIFQFDATTWGWIHLLLGVVLILAGLGVLRGGVVGRTIAVIIVGISAIANFIFLLGWEQPGLVDPAHRAGRGDHLGADRARARHHRGVLSTPGPDRALSTALRGASRSRGAPRKREGQREPAAAGPAAPRRTTRPAGPAGSSRSAGGR